ncbi:hypothetical protein [Ornithinibacillus halophilus]|uniref:Uncharacterized protein n=1 Tax=Ornithinibacillus halophilus TaxID=930117 RepID=A0A1M5EW18_9BACI|nr:hypothetical protein [Ornithinibacillus halophilus]SHF83316.1 hypothetical protein SAMN05216225_100661 [Ornithinibacillus halophilus]
MLPTWALENIAIFVISFIAGFLFYYVISPIERLEKKKHLEEVLSMLINFVVYIWISKIIINIGLFFTDPIAVLAYPSNAQAFYLATVLTGIHIAYKVRKHNWDVMRFISTFTFVFIAASFCYEFIQIMWVGDTYTWLYLIVLFVLLLGVVVLHNKISINTLIFSTWVGWVVGQLILSLLTPFITVFGYMISPVFLIALLTICLVWTYVFKRKRVK